MFKKPYSTAMLLVTKNDHDVIGKISPFARRYLEASLQGTVEHNHEPIKPGLYTIHFKREGIKLNLTLKPFLHR